MVQIKGSGIDSGGLGEAVRAVPVREQQEPRHLKNIHYSAQPCSSFDKLRMNRVGLHPACFRPRLPVSLGQVTEDLETRVNEHQEGTLPGYTKTRLPVELVFSDELPSRNDALDREKQIKGWSRAKKEALIAGEREKLKGLSKGRSLSGL